MNRNCCTEQTSSHPVLNCTGDEKRTPLPEGHPGVFHRERENEILAKKN